MYGASMHVPERSCKCSLSRLPDPVEQFDVSHQAQLGWWQDSLGWKCHDAERVSQ